VDALYVISLSSPSVPPVTVMLPARSVAFQVKLLPGSSLKVKVMVSLG
jgi:hypothetical protein